MNALLFFVLAAPNDELRTFNGITAAEIANGSGNVSIEASTDGTASVRSRTVQGKCTPEVKADGGKLKITIERSRFFDNCEVNLEIKLPKAARMDVSLGSGNVNIKGMESTLKLSTGSGDIAVDGPLGDAEIKTGSGDIKLQGLTGSARIKTGSGDLSVRYGKAPQKGELIFKTGSGDAHLEFPKGSAVQVDFESGSGELLDRLGAKAAAPFIVRTRSGSGDVLLASY